MLATGVILYKASDRRLEIIRKHLLTHLSNTLDNYSNNQDTMKVTAAAALFAGLVAAGPVELAERQSCPKVYIFGARETTVPQSNGYGTAGGLVNSVKAAYSGAGSEAIVYPACGGGSACGGVSYDNSASQGTAAVVKAVTAYNQKCPSTQIVLIGYSQVSNAHR
jgi:acetylxylan esterase